MMVLAAGIEKMRNNKRANWVIEVLYGHELAGLRRYSYVRLIGTR